MYSILAYVYIFSFMFQNIQLLRKYGSITMIGEYYLLPISIVILYFFKTRNKNYILRSYKDFIRYNFILNLLISVIITFTNKILIYGENIYIKSIHILLGILFQYITLVAMIKILEKVSLKKIKKILRVNYIVIFIIFIIEKYILNNKGRIVLTFAEPSAAGYYVLILGILNLYFNEKKIIRMIIMGTILYMNFFIMSKGAILCGLITIVFLVIKEKRKRYITMILILFITMIGYEKILLSFQNDIKYFTSVITRSWSIITAAMCFIIFPFGSGGGYLISYSLVGEKIKKILEVKYSFFNFEEIKFMLDTGIALSPKSGFFFGLLVAGIGYLKFTYNNFRYFYSKVKDNNILVVLLLFFFISNIIYSSEFQAPIQILIYSILIKIVNERRENL